MIRIAEADSTDADLLGLIATHAQYCSAHTPNGSGHAVAPIASDLTEIRYWVAYTEGLAVGCIGLCPIDSNHAEIKTMHVLARARGQGIGISLINRLFSEALNRGFNRLSLETGLGNGFAASRALYENAGFNQTEPFAGYCDDPFSFCMTRQL